MTTRHTTHDGTTHRKRDVDVDDPLTYMHANGFGAYTAEAREVLPDDWADRYHHRPRVMAYGLTYYVGYQDYTQAEIADVYGLRSQQSVARPYQTLKNDLGSPDQ